MQNKRLILVLGILVLLGGAAAFIGGRLLNQKAGPVNTGMPIGGGDAVSLAVNVTPASELPAIPADVTGLFVERNDKTIVVQEISLDAGGGGMVGGQPGADGPKVEVVVANETVIYLETTEFSGSPSENTTIQQTVSDGTLDDLTSQSFVTVWGRKSGDRIVADVILISNPVMMQRP